ncbi:MAG: hypothetical protein ACRDIX_07330 [Actinomycetota bacterium]
MIELHLFAVGTFEPTAGGSGQLFRPENRWGWRVVSERTGQELFRAKAWWPSPITAFLDGDRFCTVAVARLNRARRERETQP